MTPLSRILEDITKELDRESKELSDIAGEIHVAVWNDPDPINCDRLKRAQTNIFNIIKLSDAAKVIRSVGKDEEDE